MVCIIPENQKIKYGIKSERIERHNMRKYEKNSDVSIAQKEKI